jgi:hypothetical protein
MEQTPSSESVNLPPGQYHSAINVFRRDFGINIFVCSPYLGVLGSVVVEALCYKPEDLGIASR